MSTAMLRIAGVVILAAGLVGDADGLLVRPAFGQKTPNAEGAKGEVKPPDLVGRVTAVSDDGKQFSLETALRAKGEKPLKNEIKLTGTTAMSFFDVGRDKARVTVGYQAMVWLAPGSTDTAATIRFFGQESLKRAPDLTGRVTAVADAGGKITVGIPATASKVKGVAGQEAKSIEITIPEGAAVTYFAVGPHAAQPAEGYEVMVWLEDESKDVAASVNFTGSVDPVQMKKGGSEKAPDVSGRVVDFTSATNRLAIELPRQTKTEEVKQTEVLLTDKTAISYHSVKTGEAEPTEGYEAQVWLQDGAERVATKVRFTGKAKQGPDVFGPVLAVSDDGMKITVAGAPKAKGEPGGEVTVSLTPKTKAAFQNVPLNGAKPTVGYQAQVWLTQPDGTTAARAMFIGGKGGKG